MTNPSKFIGIFLLLGVGVFSVYLIAKNFLPYRDTQSSSGQFNLKTSIQNLFSTAKNSISSQSNQNQATTTPNLTDSLSQFLTNKITSEKNTGQSVTSTQNINKFSDEITNYLSTTTVNFFLTINEKDLKISQDNSAQSQLNYLKSTQDISQKYIKEYNYNQPAIDVFNEIISKNDTSSAQKVADGSKAVLNDYYQVAVPSNWVDFHKKLLSYFSANQMIYEAIANYKNDSVKAYLAVKEVPQLSTLAEELQKILTEQVINNNLDLNKL